MVGWLVGWLVATDSLPDCSFCFHSRQLMMSWSDFSSNSSWMCASLEKMGRSVGRQSGGGRLVGRHVRLVGVDYFYSFFGLLFLIFYISIFFFLFYSSFFSTFKYISFIIFLTGEHRSSCRCRLNRLSRHRNGAFCNCFDGIPTPSW